MKLLSKAIVNLETAELLYNKSKQSEYLSDANFSLACYNIQQALELFVKFTIDYNNDTFKCTHEINDNIDKCLSYINNKELEDTINENLGLFDLVSKWSTDSRYKDDFAASRIVFDKIVKLCKLFKEYYKEVKPEEDRDVRIKLSTLINEMKCLCCINRKKCVEERNLKDECINSNYKNFKENE